MSNKSLRASITFVDIVTSVTHVVPVAQVGHVLMTVSAEMDTTGRYRYIQELAVVTDAVSLASGKAFSDSTDGFADSQTLNFDKAPSDSVSIADSIVAVLIFIRELVETLTVTDAKALLVSPAYVETLTPVDTIAFSHSKAFADGFSMNDMADAGGPIWSFSDTTANIVTMSDTSLLSNDKGVSDSVSATDGGVLSMQDYCDLTYFAGDYVGVSRTF